MKRILAIERSSLYYGSAVNLKDWVQFYTKRSLAQVDVLIGEEGELSEKMAAVGARVENIALPKKLNNYGKSVLKVRNLVPSLFSYILYNLRVIKKLMNRNYEVVVFNNYRSSVFYLIYLIYLRTFSSSRIVLRLQISQTPLKFIFQLTCALAHTIIVHGTPEYCKREFGKRLFSLNKTICLPNPVNIDKYKFDNSLRRLHRRKLGIAEDKIVIMSVSYIEPRKGVLDLVKCFVNANKNMILIHVGDHGSHDEYLREVLDAANNDVMFLGKRSDVNELYSIADVFALNSEYEGMPYVIVEAMASGLPILSTFAGSNEEVVTNDVGTLIPYGDNEALTASISSIPRNIEGLKLAGRNARRRALEVYSDEKYFNKLMGII